MTKELIMKELLKLYRELKLSAFYTESSLKLLYEINELEEFLKELEELEE